MKSTFCVLLLLFSLAAKTQSIVADSLFGGVGVEMDADGNAWVASSGSGKNDGAVFFVRPNGSVTPVIIGLSSFVLDTASGEVQGAWRTMQLPDKKMAVLDAGKGGISIFDLKNFVPGQSPPMTAASAMSFIPISDFSLQNAPANKQETNPYSAARDAAGNWYVADAAFNGIIRVDVTTGQRSIFCKFSPVANPTPVGPPVTDYVPTKIIARPQGGFYVCNLTGFPFVEGGASVVIVSETGQVTSYTKGLTLLTDMTLDRQTGDLYVLQFAKFAFAGPMPGPQLNTAKILRIKPGGTNIETIAENFGPAAGIALDGQGNLYATHLFFGLLLKWNKIATSIFEPVLIPEAVIFPNPVQAEFSFQNPDWHTADLRIFDAGGRVVLQRKKLTSAEKIPVRELASGIYFFQLLTENGAKIGRFTKS